MSDIERLRQRVSELEREQDSYRREIQTWYDKLQAADARLAAAEKWKWKVIPLLSVIAQDLEEKGTLPAMANGVRAIIKEASDETPY